MPTVHVIVMWGQSNELGNTSGTGPAGIPSSAIRYLDSSPGVYQDTAFKDLDRRATGHYGPELTMGLGVLSYLPAGDQLRIVKVTKGATSVGAWLPGDASGLYTALMAQLDIAKAAIAAEKPGWPVRWYVHSDIGETDAAGATAPTSYAAFHRVVTDGIRVRVGESGMFPVVDLTNAAQTSNTNLTTLRAQEALGAYRIVSFDDIPVGSDYDGLHYSATPGGQQLRGTRIAAAFRDVIYMGSISDYLVHKNHDHVLGGGDYTRAATVYLAAFKLGVESTQIARKAVTNNATNFPAATGRVKSLAVQTTFAAASADAGDIDEIRVYDASSGGNELARDAITPVTVNSGGFLEIAANALTFTFAAGCFADYLANKMLDHDFGGGDYTRPANVYLGGCSADPQTGGSLVTPERKIVANNATNWPAAVARAKTLANGPFDHTAQSGSAAVSHIGIWDALTSGNLLYSYALDIPRALVSGQLLAYRTGEVVLAVSP